MTEPGLQERMARLEGRVEDFGDRFDGLDRRFDSLERRMDGRFEAVELRLASLETTVSTQFRWLVGGQVTLLVTLVAAFSAALFLG